MPLAWYECPYKQKRPMGVLVRYCAMDDFTQDIAAARNGYWEETEIDGNKALVLVTSTNAMLDSLALQFLRLTQAQVDQRWTPVRKVPRYDPVNDIIRFDSGKEAPCRTVKSVATKVIDDGRPRSGELKTLIGLWLGIGFTLGWRIPYWLALHLALSVGEPTLFWKELLLFTFNTHGVFPASAVLDTFTGADVNPLPAPWTNTFSGGSNFRRLANAAAGQGTGVHCGSHWTTTLFGGNNNGVETFVDLPTAFGAETTTYLKVTARVIDGGLTTTDHYASEMFNTNNHRVMRVDDGSNTVLGSTGTVAIAAGDSWGMEHSNAQVVAWRKPSGGSWGVVTTRADGTYTAAGYPGLGTNSGVARFDNFGGGTVVSFLPLFKSFHKLIQLKK